MLFKRLGSVLCMKKLLVVVDMQNDFIDGSLGTDDAKWIVNNVVKKINYYRQNGWGVIFTRDTHEENYLDTQEGKNLPVKHCIKGTHGWELCSKLDINDSKICDKNSFGSPELAQYVKDADADEVELVGLCTDICVISNALLIKAYLPEAKVIVDSACCAGVTPTSHANALSAMKMCQIDIK